MNDVEQCSCTQKWSWLQVTQQQGHQWVVQTLALLPADVAADGDKRHLLETSGATAAAGTEASNLE